MKQNDRQTGATEQPLICTEVVACGWRGDYDVIAGHNRVEAAKRLGWDEIEAEVKDVDDDEATLLALKTNLMRQEMKQIEQGRVLNKMLQEHGKTQRDLAEEIGKSKDWIRKRVTLALDLHDDVVEYIDQGEISNDVASVIGAAEKSKQPNLAKYVAGRDITSVPQWVKRLSTAWTLLP